jgi:putative hydrolase of the HAD superfamily
MTAQKPKVIFFDAVGTLFGVQGSVGAIYSQLAQQFGVTADPQMLDMAFFDSFEAAGALAFPGTGAEDIAEREYGWWWAIAAETFQKVGVLNQFADFSTFFSVLYDHFSAADPWVVYPDTLNTLKHWSNQEVELGIVSNFDSRIHAVLSALELTDFFSSITISSEVGVAKPDPQVFAAALKKHSCAPEEAWHVGDSFQDDYQGARAAGLRGFWLKRPNQQT